jgi:hypothetical protein
MCIPPALSIVYLPSSRELADMDEDEKVQGHVTDSEEVEDAIRCDLERRANKGADSDFEDDGDEENENDNHGDGTWIWRG